MCPQGKAFRLMSFMAFYIALSAQAVVSTGIHQWTTSGPEGGDVSAIAVDPGSPAIVYAAFYNSNGVYKTIDGGATWGPINVGLSATSVMSLAVDPKTPTVLYAGTQDKGLFKTTDAGASWAHLGLSLRLVRSLVIDKDNPSTIYAGSVESGIFKSTDYGVTWRLIDNGLSNVNVWSLVIDQSNSAILYAGTYAGVFKSTTAGESWTQIGLESSSIFAIAVDPKNPNIIYAGSPIDGVFKTTDGGASWSGRNNGMPSLPYVYTLALDPNIPTVIYAGVFASGVYKSVDGGAKWLPINDGLEHFIVDNLRIDPASPTTLYAGTFGGGVFKSTDAGRNWTAKIKGMFATHVWSLAVNPATPSTAYAGTLTSGIFKTTDGGASWTRLSAAMGVIPSQVWGLAIDPSKPQTAYAVVNGPPSILKTTDAGADWLGVNSGLTDTAFSSIAISPSAPATLYAGSFNGKVFRSGDGGENWIQVGGALGPSNQQVRSLAVDPSDPLVVYAGVLTDGLYKSSDGGQNWVRIELPGPVFDLTALAIDPVEPNTIYAGDKGGSRRSYKSSDAGATWLPLNNLLDVWKLRIAATQHTTVFAATSRDGILKSVDEGENWSLVQGAEASPQYVAELGASPDGSILYAGTPEDGGVHVYTDVNIPPCTPDADTACLLKGRFEVEVVWRTSSANGSAEVIKFGEQRAENDESVFWWFFSPSNFEIGVKVLDACVPALGNKFWVFISGLTNQGWTVRVRDTQTGAMKSYDNVTGQLSKTISDVSAFSCP